MEGEGTDVGTNGRTQKGKKSRKQTRNIKHSGVMDRIDTLLDECESILVTGPTLVGDLVEGDSVNILEQGGSCKTTTPKTPVIPDMFLSFKKATVQECDTIPKSEPLILPR